jgi:tetratricopeptide (TPR) repeat protein
MNKLERVFKQGLALASADHLEEALNKFKEALRQKLSNKEKLWVALCHRNIGLIHEQRGEMLKAKRSHLNALKYRKPDPYTYLWLGDLAESRDELKAARRYFDLSGELAIVENDQDLLKLIAQRKLLLDKRTPARRSRKKIR